MTQELLSVVLQVAEEMICCGAEISRTEESVKRMLASYGVRRTDVFATTSHVIITIEDPEGKSHTLSCRIVSTGTDMTKLDKLNTLIRHISSTAPSPIEIKRELAVKLILSAFVSK